MFVVRGSIDLAVTPEVAFDVMRDYAAWKTWMPRAFTPVSTTREPLHVGDRLRIKLGGAPVPSTIEITVVDRAHEIAWCGGPRGVLRAEHRFLFEPTVAGTRVRSVETWAGVLAPLVRFFLEPAATRTGNEQLAGLAKGIAATQR
jgi:hypothetical protein